MTQRRRAFRAAVLFLLMPLAAGCTGAATGLVPSQSVTTAVQGWERWLRVDWTAPARPSGQAIDGYVYSNYGSPIVGVQLIAQALDGAGDVVSHKIAWVPGVVPGLQRAYFRIPGMPTTQSYRVSVWAFNIIESTDFR